MVKALKNRLFFFNSFEAGPLRRRLDKVSEVFFCDNGNYVEGIVKFGELN